MKKRILTNEDAPKKWKSFLWVALGLGLFLSLNYGAFAHLIRHYSCLLTGIHGYHFPLDPPPFPRQKPVEPDRVLRPHRPFMRGVNLGLYFKKPYDDYDRYLYDIAHTGASHVAFVISWYQKDIHADLMKPHPTKTVSDVRLITTIQQARARGLQVFLLPIIRLEERGDNDWRGVIKPRHLDRWWRNYRAYITHYAQLGKEYGVDLLSVGSELVSMEKYQNRWRSLIQSIRQIFPGTLTYSANWDHYEPVTFWEELDYIGISSYYELSKKNLPPLSVLRRKWHSIRRKIEAWKVRFPRQPLIFTEVGYYSQLGTNRYPWDYTRDQPLSLEEQRRCYQAFVDVWRKSQILQGAFFWNWFGRGGIKDKGYSPHGKPAECIMKTWFTEIAQKERKRGRSRWLLFNSTIKSPR